MIALILIVVAFVVKIIFCPRLDYTRDRCLLLWYGRKTRNYIQLLKF